MLDSLEYDMDHFQREVEDFGQSLSDATSDFIQRVVGTVERLFAGEEVGGEGLEHYISAFEGPRDALSSKESNEWLDKVFTAMAIGQLWKMSHTYIVAADVQSGQCEGDNRGPSYLKICDDAWPDKVFYIYRINPEVEATRQDEDNPFPKVCLPLFHFE